MLKYHFIVPHKSHQNIGTFYHYLNLGSHHSPYILQNIHSFSVITLNPKQKLPSISNNQQNKFVTAVLPLNGNLKVDGKTYTFSLNDKEGIVWNPKDISTVEGDEKQANFAYVAVRSPEGKKPQIQLKKYEEKTNINIEKSMVFVLEGKITYREGDIEATFKNNPNSNEVPKVFYTSKNLQIDVEQNSTILIIRDEL